LRGIADAPARSLRLLESILADIPINPAKDKKRNWEIKKKIGKGIKLYLKAINNLLVAVEFKTTVCWMPSSFLSILLSNGCQTNELEKI